MVYAFDCDYSFHTPTEDTCHPSAIQSIFSDCDNAVRLPFNAIYRVSVKTSNDYGNRQQSKSRVR